MDYKLLYNKDLHIKLSVVEEERMKKLENKFGLKKSKLIRNLINECYDKNFPDEE